MAVLRTFLEESSDADLSREMISFAVQRLMELEAKSKTAAGYINKSIVQLAQRNDCFDRL